MLNIPTLQLVAAETETGVGAVGVSLKAIILQTITFVLLFFLVKKFASEKIVQVLKDRRETIDEGLVNAEKADKRLREAKEEAQVEIDKARKEGQAIVGQAREESGEIIQAARDQSQAEHDKLVEQGYAKIEQQQKKVTKELEEQSSSLVAAATAAILGDKLDSKKDADLIDKAIKQELERA